LFLHKNLEAIQASWELPLILSKQDEYPASRRNHLQALETISHYLAPPGKLLDFGCGGGFFLGTARELGWEVYGLEPLPAHAVYARAKFHAQVKTDVLRADTYPAAFFDVIAAFQVFEHLPTPRADLEKLVSFLKPGGLMVIEVPNIDNWSVRLLGVRHRHFVQDHLYFFSAATLSALFRLAGLDVLQSYSPPRRMSLGHLVHAWAGRLLPGPVARLSASVVDRLGIAGCQVSLNLGDIITVIGRKPAVG